MAYVNARTFFSVSELMLIGIGSTTLLIVDLKPIVDLAYSVN